MSEPVTINSKQVARGLDFSLEKIEAVIKLLDEGFPVPFIARYRKDQTGNLDETQIREVEIRLNELRQLAERKQAILKAIESLGKMTPELDQKIREAKTSKRLEDLYLPYKPKRETLASTARSRGLEPLALEILEGKLTQEMLDNRAKDFVDADKGLKTEAETLLGASHIIGELFSEKVELRQKIRDLIQRSSKLVSKQIEQERPSETTNNEPVTPIIVTESAQASAATAIAASFVIEDEPISENVTDESTTANDTIATEVTVSDTSELENAVPENDAIIDETVAKIEPATEILPTAESTPASQIEAVAGDAVKHETILPPAVVTAKIVKAEKKKKKKAKATPQEVKRQAELEKLYNDYFDFESDLRRLMPYRVLAINRGEKAKVLRIRFDHDKEGIQAIVNEICVPQNHPLQEFMIECAKDALQRLLLPALERETRRDLTESAENQAVNVFAKNLRNLLLQPPLNRQRVMAIDPGLRHGCKTVALDEFGNVLAYETIYLVAQNSKKEVATDVVLKMIEQYKLTVIAIGNGTGCRETENFVVKLINEKLSGKGIGYIIVNEAGASVYSASPAAKEEFPNYDVMLRGAVSIGRRLQDPLNELVKIEPGHLGVGMYQHDVKAKHLVESLEKVVESCVNHIGVDLNRATSAILRYVAGLNQLTAKRIYEYRQQNGPFRTREQLKQVTGLGEVTYTHSAGFLKIKDGANPFDATWIHPESYDAAIKILQKSGFSEDDLRSKEKIAQIAETLKSVNIDEISQELGIGQHTVRDIITQLGRPGRDPREELPPPVFKTGIMHLEDLTPGTELTGTVLNVVDFGAFVDIGLHESGLVHISQMADRYVKDAHELVSVGDVVHVWVVEIDQQRKRISLTMLPPGTERKQERREERRPRGERRDDRPGDNRQADDNRRVDGGDARRSDQRSSDRQTGSRRNENSQQGTPVSQGDQVSNNRIAGAARSPQGGRNDRNDRNTQSQGQRGDRSRQGGEGSQSRRDGGRRNEGNRDGYGSGDRRGGGRNTDRFNRSKSFEMQSKQQKVIEPISENMKKGAEPLRSFSDLSQYLGRIQPTDSKEERRKQKEAERLARQQETDAMETVAQEPQAVEENVAAEMPSQKETNEN